MVSPRSNPPTSITPLRITDHKVNNRLDIRTQVLALAAYAVLVVLTTWPLAVAPGMYVSAGVSTDGLQNIWNVWWVKTAITGGQLNVFHTDMLFYPVGVDLFFHTLNLPAMVLALAPTLLWGPIAGFNSTVFIALLLSCYAGFRLTYYLTGSKSAAAIGGAVMGITPLAVTVGQDQPNLASLQWVVLSIEFYLRWWDTRARRYAILAGVFFALAILTVAYLEVYLSIFFALHLLWMFVTKSDAGLLPRFKSMLREVIPLGLWAGLPVVLLAGPFMVGALLTLVEGRTTLWSPLDDIRVVLNSADLLSLVAPPQWHFLGLAQSPLFSWVASEISQRAYLRLAVILLVLVGLVVASRHTRGEMWFWVLVSLVPATLALGSNLQINDQSEWNGLSFPMPFTFLRNVPGIGLVRAPDRFVTLSYVGLGVLIAFSVQVLLSTIRLKWRPILLAGVSSALLLDTLVSPEIAGTKIVPMPVGIYALTKQGAPGAVLEVPLIVHNRVDGAKMYYQTVHGRPITSGYVSRPVADPYSEACSPFRIFNMGNVPTVDIISPALTPDMMPDLLARNGVSFVTLYRQGYLEGRELSPYAQGDVHYFDALLNKIGALLAEDEIASVYKLNQPTGMIGPYFQLGTNWYSPEDSSGRIFRWVTGAETSMCFVNERPRTADLTFYATSFYKERHLELYAGERQLLNVAIPADGLFHEVSTPPMEWEAGPTLLRLYVPEGSNSPRELGLDGDIRDLSIGIHGVGFNEVQPANGK